MSRRYSEDDLDELEEIKGENPKGSHKIYFDIAIPMHPKYHKEAQDVLKKHKIPFKNGTIPGMDPTKMPIGPAHCYVEVHKKEIAGLRKKLDSLMKQYDWLNYDIVYT